MSVINLKSPPAAHLINMQSFYRVDHEDRITLVGGDWDRFAEQNDGVNLAAEHIIGSELTASIAGDTQKKYIRTILQIARVSVDPIEVDYACHAPDELRHARMKLTADPDGSVLVEHSFLSTHQRMTGEGADTEQWRPKWVPPLKQCVTCKLVQSPKGWVTREQWPLSRSQNLFWGFCPDCKPELLLNPG